MPDPVHELVETLLRFVFAPSWQQSREILERHPELLGPEVDAVLADTEARDEQEATAIRQHRALLERCRRLGLVNAFSELVTEDELGALVPPAVRGRWDRAVALDREYRRTLRAELLHQEVRAWSEVMAGRHFRRATTGFRLGVCALAGRACARRFLAHGQQGDFRNAVDLLSAAVSGLPEGSAVRGEAVLHRGHINITAAQAYGAAELLGRAAADAWEAVRTNPGDPALACDARMLLGEAALLLHRSCGDGTWLRRAESVLRSQDPALPAEAAVDHADLQRQVMLETAVVERDPELIGAVADLPPSGGTAASEPGVEDGPMLRWLQVAFLAERFDRAGDTADLDRALALTDRLADTSAPTKAMALACLGGVQYARSEGRQEYLHRAADALRGALSAGGLDAAGLVSAYYTLGTVLEQQYLRQGDRRLIAEAIALQRRAVAAADGDESRAMAVNLANALLNACTATGSPDLLDEAEAVIDPRLLTGPTRSPHALSSLGRIRLRRFLDTGDRAALDSAVELLRDSAELAAGDTDGLRIRLIALADALHRRYLRSEDREDLVASLAATERFAGLAVPVGSDGAERLRELVELASAIRRDPGGHRPEHLARYCWLRYLSFSRFFDREHDLQLTLVHLERALAAGADLAPWQEQVPALYDALVELHNWLLFTDGPALARRLVDTVRAVLQIAADHPLRDELRSLLATALGWQYELDGSRPAVEEAYSTALDLRDRMAPGTEARTLGDIAHLGVLLHRLNSDPDVLEEVVRCGTAAVAGTCENDVRLPTRLGELAYALSSRSWHTGASPDMDTAINHATRAVALLEGQPDLPVAIANLAHLHQDRYEQTADRADLQAAIDLGRRAIALDPDSPGVLSNLSFALEMRYETTGDLASLDEAVAVAEEAVAAAGSAHQDRAHCWSTLSIACRMRYHRGARRDVSDLERSVSAAREALRDMAPTHDCYSPWQVNLALALRAEFERTGAAEMIAEAIEAARRAAEAPQARPANRARAWSNLARMHLTRFMRSTEDADLDAAEDAARQAIRLVEPDSHHLARIRLDLAYALGGRLQTLRADLPLSDAEAIATEALELLGAVSAAESGLVDLRVRAGLGASKVAALHECWAEAVMHFDTTIALLPLLADRALTREGRQRLLLEIGGMAADAAAAALQDNNPAKAFELLERGRGVLLSQALDDRADLRAVRAKLPDVAAELEELLHVLNAAPDGGLDSGRLDSDRLGEARHRAALRWRDLVAQIQREEGLEDFHRAPTIEQLAPAAERAPIVAINLSTIRSDALVLTSDGQVAVVSLAPTTAAEALDRFRYFQSALGPETDDPVLANRTLTDLLRWAGTAVMGPVLQHLRHRTAPGEGQPWPHIQWMPVGVLSFLPLHAAVLPEGDHVIDRVVSSYTATVRTFQRALSRRTGPERLVRTLIAAETAAELPKAAEEAAMVRRRLSAAEPPMVGAAAGLAKVRTALAMVGWAHFACHGVTDVDHPDRSALKLHDGDLTVAEVGGLDIDAHLAYLSACSTAQGSSRLMDEALHLATAFQLAGFRHVVGTLWPVSDEAAYTFADHAYTVLAEQPFEVAQAVHTATRRLRASFSAPLLWASHIHLGPASDTT
ncbi:CHAT domain-containing protein [Streptomyces purpurascens]|uniref:CHAT domain-containing protein n=1 Tax=Streptomyces purpurascens TaxID=1924 RepID=UPI0034075348